MEVTFYTKYQGTTYSDILKSYRNYVLSKYGEAIVVFDGYEVASTKDLTHTRRSKGKLGPLVTFTSEMCLTSTKELFLSNKQNKQKFICMLVAELAKYNRQTYHDTADADLFIAMKDLLVLLLYHAKCERKKIFFMPESKKSSKVRIWNIKESKEKLETFYFFMLSLEQILLHGSVDLKKLH